MCSYICVIEQSFAASVLHLACSEGSLALLKLMSDKCPGPFRIGLAFDRDSDGCAPIHRAALLDNPELIHFLVDKV